MVAGGSGAGETALAVHLFHAIIPEAGLTVLERTLCNRPVL